MKRIAGYAVICALALGCGPLQEGPDNKPLPSDDISIKSPAESYYRGLAARAEKGLIASPRELSALIVQLIRSGDMTPEMAAPIEQAFPGMTTDNRSLGKADFDKLRNLK